LLCISCISSNATGLEWNKRRFYPAVSAATGTVTTKDASPPTGLTAAVRLYPTLRNHHYLPDLLRSVQYNWDVEDRLKALTDPLGGMMQFEHDSFGNLTKTIFGDGKAQLRNPDPVGNLFETKDRTDRRYDKGGKLLESRNATYKAAIVV